MQGFCSLAVFVPGNAYCRKDLLACPDAGINAPQPRAPEFPLCAWSIDIAGEFLHKLAVRIERQLKFLSSRVFSQERQQFFEMGVKAGFTAARQEYRVPAVVGKSPQCR